jgi:hypothetical protein
VPPAISALGLVRCRPGGAVEQQLDQLQQHFCPAKPIQQPASLPQVIGMALAGKESKENNVPTTAMESSIALSEAES